MLTTLRLPSFHKLWAEIATRADTEGWPAARFLAVLAEYALAERDMRRIRRHLNEAQLPAGKTLATFDFKALPTLPRARVEALAAGDWLDGGGNLIAIHCPAVHVYMHERGKFRHRQDAHPVRHPLPGS
jgi:DNA replication protein DnaC